MVVIRRLILFLIHTTAGLFSVSGTEINSKYVCLMNSVQAFQDIIFDQCSGFVSLTKGKKQIAIWSFQYCIPNITVVNEYKDRLFLHGNGTITIHNITNFDQGKYIVNVKTDFFSDIHEVNVYVPVAPSKTCKPIINQWGNKLHASLISEECGRPIVTTYWKGDDGVSDTHDQLLKIAEGNTAHIHTACIEGPALQCAKNVTPITTCSSYVINGSNTVSTAHEAHNNGDIHILYNALFVPVLVMLVAATVVQTLRYRRSKKEFNSSYRTLGHSEPSKEHYDSICLETFKVEKESNKSEPTLESKKPSGEEDTICLEEHKEEDQVLIKTRAEDESGMNPEQIQFLQEMSCSICSTNKKSVLFLPCSHIVACSNCSDFLQECPHCRTAIEKKKFMIWNLHP